MYKLRVITRDYLGPSVWRWRLSGALASASIMGLLLTSSASATWSGHCTLNNHCYALSEWNMRSPENVRGGVLFMTTPYATVYGWEKGAFISNEMWVSWKGGGENWIESGQTAGNGKDCCTVHAFWAYDHNGSYSEVEAPPVPQPTNHYIIQDPEANGNWCIYWGNYVLQRCFPGWYPATANQLEAGIEAAAEQEPSNEASWEVAYVDAYGRWNPWKGSLTESHFVSTANNLCIGTNWNDPAAGNGVAWTC